MNHEEKTRAQRNRDGAANGRRPSAAAPARQKRRRQLKGGSSVDAVEQVDADHKMSHDAAPRTGASPTAFSPKHVHQRLLDAYESALQDGLNPSDSVIAKKLGVRRETVNRWRRRKPGLRQWLYDQIGQHAVDLKPLVDRRVTHLALSGSPDHTKLYYQFVAKIGLAPEENAFGQGAFTLNLLIPRPPNPLPATPLTSVAPAPAGKDGGLIPRPPSPPDIPTVVLR
jgi:hypothetical protein